MSLEPCFRVAPTLRKFFRPSFRRKVHRASRMACSGPIRFRCLFHCHHWGPVRPEGAPVAEPGDPEAPERPSAEAANAPRRLPAGGPGGAPTAGCRFNAMIWPRDPKDVSDEPDAASDGGGGTTCGAISLAEFDFPPESVRCDAMGS